MIALKIKAIIYDCDGVLVDSRESNKAYYNHILEHFGQPPLAEKHLYAIQSLTASEVMAHIFAGTNLLTDALAFEKSLDNERFIPLIEIEPNTRKALTHIRQKYLTAIATNRGKSMHPLLVYHGFETFFNMVVTSYDVKHPKPDPECLNIILKNFYLLPSEVFYIGDNVIDQEMCERIQVPFIAYKNPSLKAMYHMTNHLDILDIISCHSPP